jgi:predicted ABC-type ATPase
MADARKQGFAVVVIYIGTESVEINIKRVAKRVELGGHNVPEEDVRRRYSRSLANLVLAVPLADQIVIFDNSRAAGYQLAGVIQNGAATWFEPLADWAANIRAQLQP